MAMLLSLLVAPSHGFAVDPLADPSPDPSPDHAAAVGIGEDAGDAAASDQHAQAPIIQTLGNGDQTIHLVDHGGTWSMHAENVLAEAIFDAWHEVGGPEVISKIVLDFPFTLSMHRVTTERLVERILEGYGHTLHYDASGRLERVRVYSPEPARMYKTPRLVESLGSWRQAENAAAFAASPANGADSPRTPAAALPGAP